MSESLSSLSREERQERIRDIRARKGYLLGRGLVTSDSNPGFVPGVIEDPMKYSTPYVDEDGNVAYKYRGKPVSSIRTLPANQSEFAKPTNGHSPEAYGRTALSTAVARQQEMLATGLALEQQNAEEARAGRLGRYLELLGNRAELSDEAVAGEFNGLAREFYIPRNVDEECLIMDAGGSTYGV